MKKLISVFMILCLVLAAVALTPLSAGAASDYYLVGNFNKWKVSSDYRMVANTTQDNKVEYKIYIDLHAGDELKVLSSSNTWYPDGSDNNLRITEDGNYHVYFRPNYDGNSDWHCKVLYAARKGPISNPEPTTAPTSAPTAAPTAAPTDPYIPGTILLGDADHSGTVNVFDASYILKGTTGTAGYPDYSHMSADSEDFKIADVDDSGSVNVFDANLVLRYSAGDTYAALLGIGILVTK